MIIDSHSHWLPEEIIQNAYFYSKAWGDIESQVKMMEEAVKAAAVARLFKKDILDDLAIRD